MLRLTRVFDLLNGVVQGVETRLRERCGAGQQLPVDVTDFFNRVADLSRPGGDRLTQPACGFVLAIIRGCDHPEWSVAIVHTAIVLVL